MWYDEELKIRVLNKSNVTFKILTADGRIVDNRMPVDRFIELGWRLF